MFSRLQTCPCGFGCGAAGALLDKEDTVMDFTLSKQQAMVQKMYKEFAENEVKPLAKKVDAEEYFPKETVEKMAKLGMMGSPT